MENRLWVYMIADQEHLQAKSCSRNCPNLEWFYESNSQRMVEWTYDWEKNLTFLVTFAPAVCLRQGVVLNSRSFWSNRAQILSVKRIRTNHQIAKCHWWVFKNTWCEKFQTMLNSYMIGNLGTYRYLFNAQARKSSSFSIYIAQSRRPPLF